MITFQPFYVVGDDCAGVEIEGDHGGTHCEAWIGSLRLGSSGLAVGSILLRGKGWPNTHEIVHVEPAGFGDTVTPRFTADEHATSPFAATHGRSSFNLLAFSVVCNSWQDLAI